MRYYEQKSDYLLRISDFTRTHRHYVLGSVVFIAIAAILRVLMGSYWFGEHLATLMLVALTIIMLSILLGQISAVKESTERQERNNRDWQTLQYLQSSRNEQYSELFSDSDDLKSKISQAAADPPGAPLDSSTTQQLMKYLAHCEHLASAINCGAANLHLLNKTSGAHLLTRYGLLSEYIRFRRRPPEKDRIYDQLDRLIDSLLWLRANSYIIDNNTVIQCRQRYAREEDVQRLKSLVHRNQAGQTGRVWTNRFSHARADSYPQLSQLLASSGLSDLEFLVMSYSNVSMYRIESIPNPRDDLTIREIASVFASSYEHTAGTYPPLGKQGLLNSSSADPEPERVLQASMHWLRFGTRDNLDANRELSSPTHCFGIKSLFPTDTPQRIWGYIEIHEDVSSCNDEGLKSILTQHKSRIDQMLQSSRSQEDWADRLCLISRLALHVDILDRSLGRLLFRNALRYCRENLGKVPVLSVISRDPDDNHEYLARARRLYIKEGGTKIATYRGSTEYELDVYMF